MSLHRMNQEKVVFWIDVAAQRNTLSPHFKSEALASRVEWRHLDTAKHVLLNLESLRPCSLVNVGLRYDFDWIRRRPLPYIMSNICCWGATGKSSLQSSEQAHNIMTLMLDQLHRRTGINVSNMALQMPPTIVLHWQLPVYPGWQGLSRRLHADLNDGCRFSKTLLGGRCFR